MDPGCFSALFPSLQLAYVSWKSKWGAAWHAQLKLYWPCLEGKDCLMHLDSCFQLSEGGIWLLLNSVTLLTRVHHWCITNLISFAVKLLTTWSTCYICIANYSCLGIEPCLFPHWINILCFSAAFLLAKLIWIPSLSSSLFVVPTRFVICRFRNSLRFHKSVLKTKVLIFGTHPNLEIQCNQEMHLILKQCLSYCEILSCLFPSDVNMRGTMLV